ncbi:MAG TPA: propionate catabolism operon regulatory protein PrpR [Povalibacter sp.]|uniref:propionate catabolism operon regulatory protein PrpR n=1 Tax=Povalibacter sp. TaxID=1962978 RepID=UPI002C672FE8|nr:propionate catabolism operon regulatory protein PrpR [Povalibacter sp.]HMN46648.1 propionate catabolism operon regulatory protein PrpR [Povalibacter sp.]
MTPETTAPLPQRKPRVVAVGLHRLRSFFNELAPSYADRATVSVLDRGFEEAVTEIRAMAAEEQVDVLVAAGSNGEYLRQRLNIPVVLVRVGGFDIMRALGRARDLSNRIALVTYGATPPDVQQFNELFQLGIEQRSYHTDQDASDCVRELRARGIEVVVAPGLVADLADQNGMRGVFLYSMDAVRQALDDAIEVVRIARIEVARRERLNTILARLRDGVVAVDMNERIYALNPAMERVLGLSASQAIGSRLGEVAPELSLGDVLQSARTETDELQRFGSRTLITNRMPLMEQGVQTGAVLTCQDPAAIERVDRHLRARRYRTTSVVRYKLSDLVGDCAAIQRARRLAAQYANGEGTVLIVGESGTGKELLAQGIHHASRRSSQPFIAINCASFTETLLESELFGYEDGAFTGARKGGKAGLFEAAHTGTIFLDEIGEMPISLQTRLLRVLQEREVLRIGAVEPTRVDVRIIAATHRDLSTRIDEQKFRRDLYYRLNILRVELPSLRERREDLPVLLQHIVARACARLHVDRKAVDVLAAQLIEAAADYEWPGNVRELENLIERIASSVAGADARDIQLRELIPEIYATNAAPAATAELADRRSRVEADWVRKVLEECGGDRDEACRRLGIGRTTLWRKLKQG